MNIQTFHSSSTGNLYRVSDGKTPLLIECGIPIRKISQALDFRLTEIAACLISHEHKDHAKAAKDLPKAGIDCYMTKGTLDALDLSGHRYHVIKAGVQFQVGSWQILPFRAVHNAAEPVGFLLVSGTEKLVFVTDTLCVRPRFQGLTHIMIEANYDIEILLNSERDINVKKYVLQNHMSIQTAKEFLRTNDMSRVEEIHLLHLSNNNSNAEVFKKEIQEITARPVYIGG